jgi:hypothetical protein
LARARAARAMKSWPARPEFTGPALCGYLDGITCPEAFASLHTSSPPICHLRWPSHAVAQAPQPHAQATKKQASGGRRTGADERSCHHLHSVLFFTVVEAVGSQSRGLLGYGSRRMPSTSTVYSVDALTRRADAERFAHRLSPHLGTSNPHNRDTMYGSMRQVHNVDCPFRSQALCSFSR